MSIFAKLVLNESQGEEGNDLRLVENEENGHPWYTLDGWDEDQIEQDTDLMSWIERVEELAYELRSAVRGGYALEGDEVTDLNNYIDGLKMGLDEISEKIEDATHG